MSITARQMLVPSSKWGIKCPYTMTAEAITVHNTANDASANNEISYMISNNAQVSYHFAIDDKEVVQGLPLDRNGWHAGDGGNGKGNRKTIGIEICYSLSGGDRFVKAERLAAKFIAQLLEERGWGIEKVTKHQDYSGKYCPHRTLDMGWNRFLDMVSAELSALARKPIVWETIPRTTFVTATNTALYNLDTGEIVRNYGIDVSMEFVEQTEVNDAIYYRTKYSKDNNLNNGVPANDVNAFEPQEGIIKWTTLPSPVSKVALRDCALINLKTGGIIKTFTLGEQIDNLVDTAEMNGEVYYRTEYSRISKKSYGIPSYQLADIQPVYSEAISKPDGDLTPSSPVLDDGSNEVLKTKQSLVTFIINLVKKLLNK